MKKFITIIISGLLLTACNSQTNDRAVSDPIEEIPTEPVFTEYNAEDFADIPVKLNKQESVPPISVTEYDLSGITFEEKQSPCKLPENREKCYNDTYWSDIMSFDKFLELSQDALNTPSNPAIGITAFDGENLYYIADYDDFCQSSISHCFDIYRYSPKTGENTCVFEYFGIEEQYSPSQMEWHYGSLWLMSDNETIYRLDEEKAELTDAFAFPDSNYNTFYQYEGERLIVLSVFYADKASYKLWEYNDSENKWDVLYSGEALPKMYCGKIVDETVENRTTTIECEDFLLRTGIRGASLEAASENNLSFMVNDNMSSTLYTYNLPKKERYALDLSKFGRGLQAYPIGDNVIISNGDGYYAYIIPELGSFFSLTISNITEKVNNDSFQYTNNWYISVYGEKAAITKSEYAGYRVYSGRGMTPDESKEPPLKKLLIIG